MKKNLIMVIAAAVITLFAGCGNGSSGSAGLTGPAGETGTDGDDGSAGAGITWVNVTGSSVQAEPNKGYIANSSLQVVITLPPSSSLNIGDIVKVSGVGAGGWIIAQNAGQSITAKSLIGNLWKSNGPLSIWQIYCLVSGRDQTGRRKIDLGGREMVVFIPPLIQAQPGW